MNRGDKEAKREFVRKERERPLSRKILYWQAAANRGGNALVEQESASEKVDSEGNRPRPAEVISSSTEC